MSGMNNIFMRLYRRALTLVEILVAVGLLSAVMIPVMLTFGAGSRGLTMSAEDLTTHTAALELVEQMMAAPFDLVPTGVFSHDRIRDGQTMSPTTPLQFHVSDVPGIERRMTVSEVSKNGVVRFKKIVVTVTMAGRDAKGSGRSVTVKTLLAKEN